MTILTMKFDIVIYSKALNLNFSHMAWFMDIFMSLIASFALFNLCKSRIPSLFIFLIMLISIFKLYPLFIFSNDYLSIDSSAVHGNYITSNHQSNGAGDGNMYLTVFVYKEKFPLFFIKQGRYSEYVPFSGKTFKNYSNNKYTIIKNGMMLSYGDFNIPLN